MSLRRLFLAMDLAIMLMILVAVVPAKSAVMRGDSGTSVTMTERVQPILGPRVQPILGPLAQRGESLPAIRQRLQQRGLRILDAQLVERGGRRVYRIKAIDRGGNVQLLRIDAAR